MIRMKSVERMHDLHYAAFVERYSLRASYATVAALKGMLAELRMRERTSHTSSHRHVLRRTIGTVQSRIAMLRLRTGV